MSSHCPYCHSTKSILVGNVYCSKHGAGMEKLDTGTLFIKSSKLEETDWHVSRLSIRLMLNGEQHYRVGQRDCTVSRHNFLVVNQGQTYKTSFQDTSDLEMLMVGFKPGFAEGIFQAIVRPEEWLLDNPFHAPDTPLHFFEKTYDADGEISAIFSRLRKMVNEEDATHKKTMNPDALYTALIERLIGLHFDIYKYIDAKSQVKRATRVELYKRLSIAKDFMDAHYHTDISLETVSAASYLSVSHFKRLFKEYYGVNPHQYIISRRLEKARELLAESGLPVRSVCASVGFENPSSFTRLFRSRYDSTPLSFREGSL